MKVIISNAFSISMLKSYEDVEVRFKKVDFELVKKMVIELPFESIVGHEGTARFFSQLLGVKVEANRTFYELKPGETLIVGSLNQRLPEGKVLSYEELLEIPVEWWLVEVKMGE